MKPFVISLGALALVASLLAAGAGAARPEAPLAAPPAKGQSRPGAAFAAELPADRDGSAILTTPAPGATAFASKAPRARASNSST